MADRQGENTAVSDDYVAEEVEYDGVGSSDEFAELEDDIDSLEALREQRREELKRDFDRIRALQEVGHGKCVEMTDEKEVIRTSANEKRCIIHFYHEDFKRCQIMDKHLEILAPKHFSTLFLKVSVKHVPWLVERLEIKVLPCVICFIDGISKDRLIGFEEFGNSDGFKTAALELRLLKSGVIDSLVESTSSMHGIKKYRSIRGPANTGSDEDYDFDY